MTKTREEIESVIAGFLQEHGEHYMTCALATCSDNQARCTPVDARADGLTMYFVCDGGGKLENMKTNPHVCLAVFIPVGKGYMKNALGLQMWGMARVLTMEDSPCEFARGADIIRIDEISASFTGAALSEAVKATLTIIKVVPEKIAYFDSTGPGPEPVRYLWDALGQ
jgi:hypothetical protein